MSRFVLAGMFIAACADPAPAPEAQPGTYQMTAGQYAGGGSIDLWQTMTFDVAPTADGIAITSSALILQGIASDLPRIGDRYEVEHYSAGIGGCSANKVDGRLMTGG